jgi:SGNH domain (fused to AT3 domains)
LPSQRSGESLLKDSDAVQNRALGNFATLVSHLVHAGKKVFVLLDTPSSDVYDPEKLMPAGWRRLLARPKSPESPTRLQMEKFVGKISDKIRRVAEAAGARVIKPLDYLCDSEFCPIADRNDHLMYYNYASAVLRSRLCNLHRSDIPAGCRSSAAGRRGIRTVATLTVSRVLPFNRSCLWL